MGQYKAKSKQKFRKIIEVNAEDERGVTIGELTSSGDIKLYESYECKRDPIWIWWEDNTLRNILLKELRSPSWKGRILSFSQRLALWFIVMELAEQGMAVSEIQNKINKEYGINLSRSVIRDWIRGKSKPHGKVNIIDPYSPYIGRILGAIITEGDERITHDKGEINVYRASIYNLDPSYIEYIKEALEKLKISYEIYQHKETKRIEIYSVFLYILLKHVFYYILHAPKDIQREFLMSAFAGDGCFSSGIYLGNTDLKIIAIISALLRKFNIKGQIRGPYKPGGRGKYGYGKKPMYHIVINPLFHNKFSREIGAVKESHKRNLEKLLTKRKRGFRRSKYILSDF